MAFDHTTILLQNSNLPTQQKQKQKKNFQFGLKTHHPSPSSLGLTDKVPQKRNNKFKELDFK